MAYIGKQIKVNRVKYTPLSADPSNPEEGDVFRSDGTARPKGLWEYKDSAWSQIGSENASGGINYITNGNAETDVTGWATYADAAGTIPVDGTGGSANITFTRNTSTPLRDTGDFKIAKDAANRQGEGAGFAFTIDNADKARKLFCSFDYDCSAANYADDDIKLFVYDVTNAALIRVNGEDLKAGSGKHYFQFQTAADSTSYRLIFHVSSTNATAYDIYIDNVELGPRELAYGAIDVYLGELTTTGSWTTNTSYTGKYWRVGDRLRGEVTVSLSGAPDVTSLIVNLPSGYQMVAKTIYDNVEISAGGWDSNQYAAMNLQAYYASATSIGVMYQSDILFQSGQSLVNNTAPVTWASGDRISLQYEVPIAGWSSNAQMSEDLGNRDIVFTAKKSTTQSITAGTPTVVTGWDTPEIDTIAGFNATTGLYTVPESGNYEISGKIGFTSQAVTGYVYAEIYKNSTLVCFGTIEYHNNVDGVSSAIPGIISNCAKGDVIRLYATAITADASVRALSDSTWLSIAKLASPQTVLESETVAARYTTDATQSIPDASDTTVVYEDLVFDTHNAMNTTTGVYTVPVSGYYSVSASVGAFLPASTDFLSSIIVNSTGVSRGVRATSTPAGGSYNYTTANSILKLNAGDAVAIQFYQDNAGSSAVTLEATGTVNYFSIAKIK